MPEPVSFGEMLVGFGVAVGGGVERGVVVERCGARVDVAVATTSVLTVLALAVPVGSFVAVAAGAVVVNVGVAKNCVGADDRVQVSVGVADWPPTEAVGLPAASVADGVCVGVSVAVGVSVGVMVAVAVGVALGFTVGVRRARVGVGVAVAGLGVFVGVSVDVGGTVVPLAVAVGTVVVTFAVAVALAVAVAAGVGVSLGVTSVSVGDIVGVAATVVSVAV